MTKFKKLWGLFFSLLFLWLALRKLDLQAMAKVLSNIKHVYLLLFILSYTIELATRAHRWMLIQSGVGFKYSFFGEILCYFFNNILPARAGEFFRPYYFAKKGLANSGKTLGAVVLERFFDGVMLFSMVLISFQQFPNNDLLKKAGVIAGVFYSFIFIGILLAILKKSLYKKITKFCVAFLPAKVKSFIFKLAIRFADGLSAIKNIKRLIKILLSSALCWLSSVTTFWICFQAFSFEGNFITSAFALTIMSLSSLIPASPGNLGVYEYFCIFIISNILGHTEEQGAAFSLIAHGLSYLYILVAGVILLFMEGIKLNDITAQNQKDI